MPLLGISLFVLSLCIVGNNGRSLNEEFLFEDNDQTQDLNKRYGERRPEDLVIENLIGKNNVKTRPRHKTEYGSKDAQPDVNPGKSPPSEKDLTEESVIPREIEINAAVESDTSTQPSEKSAPHAQPLQQRAYHENSKEGTGGFGDASFIILTVGCSVAGLVGLIIAGVCWYRLQKTAKAAEETDYPAYGVTGPKGDQPGPQGDRKLAQSVQMYHYQHQKQQMIAMEKASGEMKQDASDEESEEENEEGDYTVYECPGLAPTGEMEVKNPLFNEESKRGAAEKDKGQGQGHG